MSNIASRRRTEPLDARRTLSLDGFGTLLATAILCAVLIPFRLFETDPPDLGDGGDFLNQIGFSLIGAASAFGLFTFVDRRVLGALLSPWWLIMLGFLALSVMNADDPAEAMRAGIFTLIGMVAMAALLTLPRDAEAFSRMFAIAGFVVVGLSYFGILAFPDAAIHPGGGVEPQHQGFWRGVFTHKNIAGPVMACFSFAGIYLLRRGRMLVGGLLFLGAMLFMLNTGSKTTAGLVPLAILLVLLPGLIGMRFLVPAVLTAAIIGTALGTLGIVFIEPLRDFAAEHFPNLTYTGRTALWAYSGEALMDRPWTGFGYESFWGTERVQTAEQHFDQLWDIRGIVHGHNGYMDLAIFMGIPALVFAVITFILVPMRDYAKVPPLEENVFLADLFIMICAFTLLNAFLESFFFRRVDPVWLFFVMAALGLRLVARFPVAARRG